jgi:hypothetical protein
MRIAVKRKRHEPGRDKRGASMPPTLSLGEITVTENAATALTAAGQEAEEFLHRHSQGDWGDLSAYEKQEHDQGLARGSRTVLLSAYPLKTDQTVWVITHLEQDTTIVMLPKEWLIAVKGGTA